MEKRRAANPVLTKLAHRDMIHSCGVGSSSDLEAWRWWTADSDPAGKLNSASLYVAQFPVLRDMDGVKQNPKYHTENVWKHTILVVNEVSRHPGLALLPSTKRTAVMYAALLHDAGKPRVTRRVGGRISSRGHADVSATLAEKFLLDIGEDTEIVQQVERLCRFHMRFRVDPGSCPEHLVAQSIILSESDLKGRVPWEQK